MEVHHHSHTPRRKWMHYFWEFFMLFLAVTLGFFVENQREHYIEHKRAKVYAGGMLKNLESDIYDLKNFIRRGEYAVNYLDSFLLLISNHELRDISTGKLYFYGLWGGYLRGFIPNDATFQQMKNSGSLRYFKNPELEERIGEYDKLCRAMATLNEIELPIYLETRKARSHIFDFRYNNEANRIVQTAVYANFNQAAIDSFLRSNPPLLTTDRVAFNEYAELCRSRNLKQQLSNANEALTLAASVVALLKKEFHYE